MPTTPKFRLVSFDMDGTLIRGMSSLQHVANQLGHTDKALELEHAYVHKTMSDAEQTKAFAMLFKGVPQQTILAAIETLPLMQNITETVTELKKMGYIVGINTLGPKFVSSFLAQKHGFDFSFGCDHIFDAGTHTGIVTSVLVPEDKVTHLLSVCKQYDLQPDQVIAIGDSRSDLPVFAVSGYKIALNANHTLNDKADTYLQTEDLLDVVDIIATLTYFA
jgi:phosphoserine phosphatase